jgi:hypothetical protein
MEIVSRAFNSSLSLFLLFTLAGCADLHTRVDQLEAENNAQQAEIDALNHQFMDLEICTPGAPTRFVDNGDGTVCDHQTGLMWEMKDAADGSPNLNNPRDVNNSYTWSSTGTAPDGTAFTDFLARLNGTLAGTSPSEQLGGYRDWRLPASAELQTILDCSFGSPCIDPVFGPTVGFYWSSTSAAGDPSNAWAVGFNSGNVGGVNKRLDGRVRAVRGGR